MKLKKKLIISTILSSTVTILSYVFPIIPCRTAPGVPNPVYKYLLCSLNGNNTNSLESIKEYYLYTQSLLNAYIITFLITFIVVLLFLFFTTKKRNKK